MKIKFEFCEFEVAEVAYNVDKFGKPVDISIVSDKDTLLAISEFASVGCNIQETYRVEMKKAYEALYARLDDFEIIDAEYAYYH